MRLSFLLIFVSSLAQASWFDDVGLSPGPYAVGYKLILERDRARIFADGASGNRPTPVPVSLWYPAGATSFAPMRLRDYWAIDQAAGITRAPDAPLDLTALRDGIRGNARVAFASDLDDTRVTRILDTPMLARREAAPAQGRFPVVVGGLAAPRSSAAIAEYLASYGYVVVSAPNVPKTGTLQATKPQLALDMQTRALEFLYGFAQTLPQADISKFALVGVNFDGMAAVLFEMRNMAASAVVSLDGWEGKENGGEILRSSPYYDVQRLRVPYLAFMQNEEQQRPGLAIDNKFFDSLRYSERAMYSLRGVNHGYYVTNLLAGEIENARGRGGIGFIFPRIVDWLEAYVRKDARAIERLKGSSTADFVHRREQHALAPVHTEEEFEALVMNGGIAPATEAYRAAKRANPDAQLFDAQTLNLFTFRFEQRGDLATAIAIMQLRNEAFPESWSGWSRLAGLQEKAGQREAAAESLNRAIRALAADSSIDQARRDSETRGFEERRKALRP